ncbi:hypothetical protein DYB32_009945 [Aphanomyces invadans]|uniref:Uncharacterized protein n=1 Tax=Aphanomyces invadans TaxID=157072 RepID=A0A3R6VEK0_9STRA|nr:hypothetical protein DYB32_009945 [Aphanomyces invadans]
MYQMPENMARHTKYTVAAVQSSVNSGYSVDLGVNCRVDTIRVWNRTGADGQRLFPCCVMVSESPFEPESGKFMLRTCKAQSVWTKFGDDCAAQNPLVWHAPEGTLGTEIDKKFLRALCADIDHLDVLKEYLAFAPSVQKFAGDVRPYITPCLLCTAQYTCPICDLFKQIPSTSLPPDVRATTSLDTFSDMLLSHRPPRTFATSAATVMMVGAPLLSAGISTVVQTDDANRLLQIAVDDEKPESDLAKAQDAVFATVHKGAVDVVAVDDVPASARPMSRSFLRNAMASSKETWQKYTSGKPPREKDTPSGQGGNADVIRVQPKSASRPPLDDDSAPQQATDAPRSDQSAPQRTTGR